MQRYRPLLWRRCRSSNKKALWIRSGLACHIGKRARYLVMASARLIPSGKRNNTISEIMVATSLIVRFSAYHLCVQAEMTLKESRAGVVVASAMSELDHLRRVRASYAAKSGNSAQDGWSEAMPIDQDLRDDGFAKGSTHPAPCFKKVAAAVATRWITPYGHSQERRPTWWRQAPRARIRRRRSRSSRSWSAGPRPS